MKASDGDLSLFLVGEKTAGPEPDALLPFITAEGALYCVPNPSSVSHPISKLSTSVVICQDASSSLHPEPFIWKLNMLNCCHNVLVLACSVQQKTLFVFVVF